MVKKSKDDIESVEAKGLEEIPASDVALKASMQIVTSNLYGIDDFKDLWVFLLSFGSALQSSMADDGKITMKDAVKFWDPVRNLPSVISGYQNIGKEVMDLTEDEINELVEIARKYVSEDVRDMVIDLSQLALNIVKFYGKYFHKAA